MIFVMSLKQFMKKKKKLAEAKDYIILDSTDSDAGDLKKFSGVITVDGFAPPKKLITEKEKEDAAIELDIFKLEKIEKKYFKSKEFRNAAMGAVKALIEADRPFNVFVVIKNKAYKNFGDKIVKRIKKTFDINSDFVYSFDDLEGNKKLLKKDIKKETIGALRDRLNKLEKEEKNK